MRNIWLWAMILVIVFSADSNFKIIDERAEKMNLQIEQLKVDIQSKEIGEAKKVVIVAMVTAYAPLDNQSGICADSNPIITSNGHYPVRGIVAVDPKEIPYGTLMFIEGYGFAIAGDTGGAIREYDGVQIDIVMDTYKEAIDWGKRKMEVIIYDI